MTHITASSHRSTPQSPVVADRRPRRSIAILLGTVACLGLLTTACGSDSDAAPTTTAAAAPSPAPTTTPTPTPTTAAPKPTPTTGAPKPTPTTVSPDAPAFLSFTVTPSARCTGGNAEFTMAYTTAHIEGLSIAIGGKGFAETAGYGPNETGVLASVPCSGAGTSSIQLKGCNASGACAESKKISVEISA